MDPVTSLHDIPEVGRYDEARDYSRGPGGTRDSTPTTLEEECAQGGWTKVTTGDGVPPYANVTIGMRGDPDGDDDLTFADGSYRNSLVDNDY